MRTKCIIFGEALRIKVKKCKQNLPESYAKGTKIAITACKFLKILCPRAPLEHFLFPNHIQISSAEKNTLEKRGNLVPLPFIKFLAAPMPALFVGKKKSDHWFCAPYFRNASAIAATCSAVQVLCFFEYKLPSK